MSFSFFLTVAGMFVIPFFAVLIPLFIGQRHGISSGKKSADIPEKPVDGAVGVSFGLLAFMLALTFQLVSNRFEVRKQLLLDEVSAIRTGYLRAGLIPEPYRSNTKKFLIEYVDQRSGKFADRDEINRVINESQKILDSVWTYAEALAAQDRSSEVYALYTTSINEIIDAHNQRISTALQYRIPPAIIIVLFIIEFFSMLVLGYQFGLAGKRSPSMSLALAIIFAVVMFLIVALDRPELGVSRLSQKPMKTLQDQLHGRQIDIQSINR